MELNCFIMNYCFSILIRMRDAMESLGREAARGMEKNSRSTVFNALCTFSSNAPYGFLIRDKNSNVYCKSSFTGCCTDFTVSSELSICPQSGGKEGCGVNTGHPRCVQPHGVREISGHAKQTQRKVVLCGTVWAYY